ncbi:site-2 protease family protein [Roseivirga echinicomitans]|uniref:Zinc metalloprotease n=1 Tax=Roseivirga echinicomitans TaxID=296218 RepID=A0A150XUQ2_9BACT|nr:site-2 protease family protein [Roseivirga echinicomitans]KYG82477.1 hypothetical protein AWN68_14580 [Roseivirga echinicomitans]
MKRSLYLGQFSKIKVFVHWTFLILIAYIVLVGLSSGQNAAQIGWHILFILTIFLCVVLHEFGHALVGRRFGFRTKDIVLLPIGGVARFEKLPENPKQEFLVSIAGPAVNFVIATIIYFAAQLSIHSVLSLDMTSVNAANFVILLWVVNLSLGFFNLIPAFPMDGGRIFRSILAMFQPREKATKIAVAVGQVLAVGFIVWGLYYNPFLIVIGAFIILAGSAESSMVHSQIWLEGYTAKDIVMHDFATMSGDTTLGDAAKNILNSQSTHFVVTDRGRIVGNINRNQIIKAITTHEEGTTLFEIMEPSTDSISSDTALKELLLNPVLKGGALIPVIEDGDILGVLNMENILEFVAIRESKSNKRLRKSTT